MSLRDTPPTLELRDLLSPRVAVRFVLASLWVQFVVSVAVFLPLSITWLLGLCWWRLITGVCTD